MASFRPLRNKQASATQLNLFDGVGEFDNVAMNSPTDHDLLFRDVCGLWHHRDTLNSVYQQAAGDEGMPMVITGLKVAAEK